MPYKRKGRVIYHLKNGHWMVKQTAANVKNAKAAVRLLYGIEHGWKPGRR